MMIEANSIRNSNQEGKMKHKWIDADVKHAVHLDNADIKCAVHLRNAHIYIKHAVHLYNVGQVTGLSCGNHNVAMIRACHQSLQQVSQH